MRREITLQVVQEGDHLEIKLGLDDARLSGATVYMGLSEDVSVGQ